MLRSLLATALAMSLGVFLGTRLQARMDEAADLDEAIMAWQETDLPSTFAWQVHVYLSRLHWLGPLRPLPPPCPLQECGIGSHRNWWVLVLRTEKTRQQARCLHQRIREVREVHSAFRSKISSLAAALCLTAFVITVQARKGQHRPADLTENDTKSYSSEESSDGSSSSLAQHEPPHDAGEASGGSASPPKAQKVQWSSCKSKESWTGREKGSTTVVEVPLGPFGSVFAEVTDIPHSMTDAWVQRATAKMAALLRARMEQVVAGHVQFSDVPQLVNAEWKSSMATHWNSLASLDLDSSPELD